MLNRVLIAISLSFVCISGAYLSISPPNAGPDELVHSRTAWYFFEEPTGILSSENYISHEFPIELTIDQEKFINGITPCVPQYQQTLGHCWTIKNPSSESVEIRTLISRNSPLYSLLIGSFQHLTWFQNPLLAGRVGSWMINLFLLLISLLILSKVSSPSKLISVYWLITPAVIFLFGVINPSSLEISLAILVVSCLYYISKREKKSRLILYVLLASQTLFVLSRPLAFLWLSLIILLFYWTMRRAFLIRISAPPVCFGFLVSAIIENRSIKLNPDSSFDPGASFYFEELIRNILNSGNWVLSIFGNLGWTEIKMPLMLIFINLIMFSFLIAQNWTSNATSWSRLGILFLGIFLIPLIISIPFSANWPMWWTGRYSIPIFVASCLVIALELRKGHRLLFILGSINHLTLLVISFWRYNWGLFSTSTPIISNGQQLPTQSALLFMLLVAAWMTLLMFVFMETRSFSRQSAQI